MSKDYQKTTARVGTDVELVLPEAVTVAMAEIGGAVKEGLLALAVATGLQVMTTMMEESVTALAGPKGRHQPTRSAVRHGTEAGSVALGGRRVPVRRPRVRAVDGSGELPVEAYEAFSGSDLLAEIALERMMAKLSTRRYRAGLEPVGTEVQATARSTSKSSVSRRFVARTETALAELMTADLTNVDVVALMIDGVHFAGHCCVVALGIGIDGTKHPLGVVEGDTENATVVKDLLAGLRDRGLDVTRPTLVVIDGAKALAAGVHAVFDHPVVQRCQLHKIRNVEAKLPKALAATVTKKIRAAYHNCDHLGAEAALEALAAAWTRLTPARRGRCGRAWLRRLPSTGSVSRRPWPARCGRPTRSSR
jgi:putative transposase